jgi:hypothetical protein
MATATEPQFKMCDCKSSQIHSIGHDPATNTLAIRFKGKNGPGSLYHYPGFTAEQFDAFRAAESKGKFFGQSIRGNAKHPHSKINEKE